MQLVFLVTHYKFDRLHQIGELSYEISSKFLFSTEHHHIALKIKTALKIFTNDVHCLSPIHFSDFHMMLNFVFNSCTAVCSLQVKNTTSVDCKLN